MSLFVIFNSIEVDYIFGEWDLAVKMISFIERNNKCVGLTWRVKVAGLDRLIESIMAFR
jgi:hypothetical protein